MKLSDIFPWAFSDAENAPEDRDVNLSTKKFSSFNVASGEGIEGVGLKDGQNVRFALTTDSVQVNPNQFRNAKGQFIGTPEELASLRNQRDVNEFFYSAIESIEQGDVNLDGYATEEWVTGQIDALDPYDDTAINESLAAEIATREAEDQALQAQIDGIEFPDPDLSGYLPLSGGEMEASATIKVNTIEPVNTPSIFYGGSESSHPMGLMNRGMISDFIDDKTDGLASVEYVDNADRILDAEIQELGLALNTLLAQRDHGQWEYVGLLQDAIPRNPGQFALQAPFTSEENVLTLNNEDLNGTTHALGNVKVGDYVEVVDLEHPDDNVLYVVTEEGLGGGSLLEVTVSLRSSSGELKIGDKCEVRFFAINQEDISISDLDARYLKLTGGTLTGTLNAPRIESQKLDGEAMMLIEGNLSGANSSAARLTLSNKTNANSYGSLSWNGNTGSGWFQFNKDLDMSSKGLHSVTRIRFNGDKAIQDGNTNRILLNGKVTIPKAGDSNTEGLTVKGKTAGGNNDDLLSVFHNSTGLDAVNYKGKQDAPTNLATVGYVDDAVSVIPESKKSRITTQVRTTFFTQARQAMASFIDSNGSLQTRPDDAVGIEYTISRDTNAYFGYKDWWGDDYEPLDTGYIQVIDPFTGKIKWAAGIGEVTRTGDTIRWMISGSIYTNYPDWNPNMDYFLNLNGCLREK